MSYRDSRLPTGQANDSDYTPYNYAMGAVQNYQMHGNISAQQAQQQQQHHQYQHHQQHHQQQQQQQQSRRTDGQPPTTYQSSSQMPGAHVDGYAGQQQYGAGGTDPNFFVYPGRLEQQQQQQNHQAQQDQHGFYAADMMVVDDNPAPYGVYSDNQLSLSQGAYQQQNYQAAAMHQQPHQQHQQPQQYGATAPAPQEFARPSLPTPQSQSQPPILPASTYYQSTPQIYHQPSSGSRSGSMPFPEARPYEQSQYKPSGGKHIPQPAPSSAYGIVTPSPTPPYSHPTQTPMKQQPKHQTARHPERKPAQQLERKPAQQPAQQPVQQPAQQPVQQPAQQPAQQAKAASGPRRASKTAKSPKRPLPASASAVSVPAPPPQNLAATSPSTVTRRSPSIASSGKSGANPIDTVPILLATAEECIQKARSAALDRGMSLDVAIADEYQDLMRTALLCLDVALQTGRLSARQEARTRLRYAALLLDETDNLMEAETTLSKGIDLCEAHRWPDLKYCMQYVLISNLSFRRSQKAGHAALDVAIKDAIALHHVHWVYVFRLLKANFFTQAGAGADPAASENFRKLVDLASRQGDTDVAILAQVLEALAALKKPDNVTRIHELMAQASKHQCDPSGEKNRLLALLGNLLCVLQNLQEKNVRQMRDALRVLQKAATESADDPALLAGQMLIAVKRHGVTSATISHETAAVIRPAGADQDYDCLVVSCMNRRRFFSLICALEGIACYSKPINVPPPAYKPLFAWAEARRRINDWNDAAETRNQAPPPPLRECIRQAKWAAKMLAYLDVYSCLYHSMHTQWLSAKESIAKLEQLVLAWFPGDTLLSRIALYLRGVFCMGTGELSRARQIFEDDTFRIVSTESTPRPWRDFCLLALLNRIWLMQTSEIQTGGPEWALLEQSASELLQETHPDRELRLACFLVLVTITHPPSTVNVLKTRINSAFNYAKETENTQGIAIALCLMRTVLFDGVVGAQAMKSAKAAELQSKRGGNVLWRSVADGQLAQSYGRQQSYALADAHFKAGLECANLALTGVPRPAPRTDMPETNVPKKEEDHD